MKKLKIALVLMFAACCSLFLFACGGENEDLTLEKELTLSGYKTDFTEASTEFTTGDIVVTAKFRTEDPEKATRVLTAEEYVVKADTIKAAIEAAKKGDYKSARGTYTVEVEYTYGERTAVAEYNVTLDHAWEKDGDIYKCNIDGAEKEVHAINDQIKIEKWASVPVLSEGAKVQTATNNANYVTYGSISLGQAITISGTGYTTGTDSWDTPVLGIQKDNNLFLAREDTWVIGSDSKWEGCAWQLHTGGSAAVAMPEGTIDSWLETATEWEVYYKGTAASSNWGSATSPVEFTITWDYNEAGYVNISTVINKTLTLNRYIKVPGPTYEVALYAEDCTFNVKELSIIRNLKLDEVTMDKEPTQTVYAENTMLDIGEDKNLKGVVLTGHYNKESDHPLDIGITSYEILATKVEGEGENAKEVTYDLRVSPLQKEMTNFRIVYGEYEFKLDKISVVASSIKGATNSYDFTHNGVQFENSGANYVYGVNKDGKIAVTGEGVADRLTAAQKKALNTQNDYFVAYHLYGDGSEKLASATCSITGAVCEVVGNGVNVIIPVGTSVPASATVTVVSDVTAETVVNVDLSNVKVPAVSAVILSNDSTLDGGGDIKVAYYGFTEDTIKDLRFYVNSGNTTYKRINNASYKLPSGLILSGKWNGNVYEVTYKVPAIDVATSEFNLSYNVRVGDASVQMPYALKVSGNANANGWYKINDTTYLASKYAGRDVLTVVVLEDSRNLQGRSDEIKLNVQNDIGTVYDLSFTATLAGTAAKNAVFTFNSANDLSNKAKGVLGISGTIGDNTDGDYGAVYLIQVEVSKALGITLADGFYVEIPGTEVEGVYTLLKYTKDKEDNVTVAPVKVKLSDVEKTDIEGTCIVNELSYYTYEGFAFGQTAKTTAFGQHKWTEKDGNKTCSLCGTAIYGKDFALGTKLNAVKNAKNNGITVSFTLKGNENDWAPAFATEDHIAVTLPNLDAYWQDEKGGVKVNFASTGNATPAAMATYYNDFGTTDDFAGYKYFLDKSDKEPIECAVLITVSPTDGITWYKDGVKVLGYKATTALSSGELTVGDFANYILAAAEEGKLVFAPELNKAQIKGASDVIVFGAALTEAQIMASNVWAYGSEEKKIDGELGNDNFEVTPFTDWVNVDPIAKGTSVTFNGTHKSKVASNWHTMLFEFSDNAHWTQRWDNYGWTFGDGELKSVSMTPSVTDKNGQAVTDWVPAYVEIVKDCTWTLTVKFEGNGTVTATLVAVGANGSTYTDVCVWNFGMGSIPDYIGIHFTAEAAHVTIESRKTELAISE